MKDLRRGPSGPVSSRIIASGTSTIAAFSTAVSGPTLKRQKNERVWVYVFPVTLTASFYGIVPIPSKQAGLAEDEWFPLFLNVAAPQPDPLVVDWIAYGGNP